MSRIWMILIARNEEDFIESWLEHHAKEPIEGVLAMDNNSTDDTARILRAHPLIKEVYTEQSLTMENGKWMTRLAQECARRGAQWVVPCDADECWRNLQFLQTHDMLGIVRVRLGRYFNHPPVQGLSDKVTPVDMPYIMAAKSDISVWSVSKKVPNFDADGRLIHRASPKAVISQGNHSVTGLGDGDADTDEIEMHHYPIRSYSQFLTKVVQGGRAYENYPGPKQHGAHKRRWYGVYLDGKLRELYDDMLITPGNVEKLLAAGTLIHDKCLAET